MFRTAQRITPEDFLRLAEQNPDKHYDFMDGEVIEVSPKIIHSWLQGIIVRLLGDYLDGHPELGKVYPEALHELNGQNFVPDVAVQQTRPPGADYFTEPPLLAVEIRSDSQSRASQRRKAQAYIELGVKMVWLIMPEEQVEVYFPDKDEPTIYTKDDTLTGGDVLPGFEVAAIQLIEETE